MDTFSFSHANIGSTVPYSGVPDTQTDSENVKTHQLIVEFKASGRFELVYTHNGLSETNTAYGLHQVYVSRFSNEPWNTHFIVNKGEYQNFPVYVCIKSMKNEILYTTVMSSRESYLALDCKDICEKIS